MRVGRFALSVPLMMSVEGRWVARTRWMPSARPRLSSRWIAGVTSALAWMKRSASSSTTITSRGRGDGISGSGSFFFRRLLASRAAIFSTSRLNPSMFRTPCSSRIRVRRSSSRQACCSTVLAWSGSRMSGVSRCGMPR